jgi:ketosteroid isomerase-like protein
MGEPGAQLVREILDALNREDVAGVLARVHPDFEWRTLESSPVGGTYRGHEQVQHYVEDWLATFEDVRIDVDEMTTAGDEVLVVVRGHGRGRGSGIEVNNRYCQVWTVREGAAVRMREYDSREQAVADLEGSAGRDA